MVTAPRASFGRWMGYGLIGGVVGAVFMAAFAMLASATYQEAGFYTPIYLIASAIGWDQAATTFEASVLAARTGDSLLWDTGPALVGAGVHLGVGLGWGAVAAILFWRTRASVLTPFIAGVYGLGVMAVMAYGILPVTADIFDSGPRIDRIYDVVGWGTFSAQHAIYGFFLGATLLLGARMLRRRIMVSAVERARRGEAA